MVARADRARAPTSASAARWPCAALSAGSVSAEAPKPGSAPPPIAISRPRASTWATMPVSYDAIPPAVWTQRSVVMPLGEVARAVRRRLPRSAGSSPKCPRT
ncbi:MAG TPA: hypothetical protein VF587_03150 [Solirubrobacteraceae bacterium]